MTIKAKVEAVLFMSDKPMRAQAIARLIGEDVDVVRRVLIELVQEYEERDSGLEIAQDNGYLIQVKDAYAPFADEMAPLDFSVAVLRTLGAIAIRQPVEQSEIIKIRGAGAYAHVRELLERQLVGKREEGRSPLLTTTRRFQEYFRLTSGAKDWRKYFKKLEAARKSQEAKSREESATSESSNPEDDTTSGVTSKAVADNVVPVDNSRAPTFGEVLS